MGELTNTKIPTRVFAARNQNLVQWPKIAAKLMEAFLPSDTNPPWVFYTVETKEEITDFIDRSGDQLLIPTNSYP